MKILKLFLMFCFFIFLNGCLQTTALLGPGLAVATNGNIIQAGAQYGANTAIKIQTGKNTLEHLQDAVEHDDEDIKFKQKFTDLVEKKFELTRKKLKLN